jgi:twitching motility protein PilT
MTAEAVEAMVSDLLPKERSNELTERGEASCALSVSDVGRFRVNFYRQRGTTAIAIRRVPIAAQTFVELDLPSALPGLLGVPHGLILVTGPAGSGKSTTVTAMIEHINATRSVRVVTIESPIEVLHRDQQAMIAQREVGSDLVGLAAGLRHIGRHDVDVIFVSELENAEVAREALLAAESGHLVLSTMVTSGAADTISRLVHYFPPAHHKQVRVSLAASLRAVVSQRLLPRADALGRVAAVAILVNTPKVADWLVHADAADWANDRHDSLEELMADGEYHGMQTFDQSLLHLCDGGLVSKRDALAVASDAHEFQLALQRIS